LISWITGEVINSWVQNQKQYVLINCQGIGYEIQTLNSLRDFISDQPIILWIQHIKKEDSDTLFGFINKDERDFFRDLLKVKGIGPQIGISLLNKYPLIKVIYSLTEENRDLISSIPGIGPKMTERIFFEFKNKFKNKYRFISEEKTNDPIENGEINLLIEDIDKALQSLDYRNKDIKIAIDFILNKVSLVNLPDKKDKKYFTFENLLKIAIDFLEKN